MQAAHLQYLLQYQQQLLMQVEQARVFGNMNPYAYPIMMGAAGPVAQDRTGLGVHPNALGLTPQQSASMMIRNMQMASVTGMKRGYQFGRSPLSVPDYAHVQVCYSVMDTSSAFWLSTSGTHSLTHVNVRLFFSILSPFVMLCLQSPILNFSVKRAQGQVVERRKHC